MCSPHRSLMKIEQADLMVVTKYLYQSLFVMKVSHI